MVALVERPLGEENERVGGNPKAKTMRPQEGRVGGNPSKTMSKDLPEEFTSPRPLPGWGWQLTSREVKGEKMDQSPLEEGKWQ
eukprot:10595658-Karenia_brevis.AAC.1